MPSWWVGGWGRPSVQGCPEDARRVLQAVASPCPPGSSSIELNRDFFVPARHPEALGTGERGGRALATQRRITLRRRPRPFPHGFSSTAPTPRGFAVVERESQETFSVSCQGISWLWPSMKVLSSNGAASAFVHRYASGPRPLPVAPPLLSNPQWFARALHLWSHLCAEASPGCGPTLHQNRPSARRAT